MAFMFCDLVGKYGAPRPSKTGGKLHKSPTLNNKPTPRAPTNMGCSCFCGVCGGGGGGV